MATPRLYITDGTTVVNLLAAPFGLRGWRPRRPTLKGGGTWRSSPFTDGRRLVSYQRDNTSDTYALMVVGYQQDDMIRAMQEADRLLIKAMDYWTSEWQQEPVYLVAKSPNETNARYSHIYAYQFPDVSNPYETPFHKRGSPLAVEDLQITIEHGPWTEFRPGTSGCAEIGAEHTFNARTYGRAASGVCDSLIDGYGYLLKEDNDRIALEDGTGFLILDGPPYEVYVGNYTADANLTHIWQFDAAPAWANLIDAIPPTTGLFATDPVGDGDIIYFGCDMTVADAGPFFSLVFDIAAVSVYTGAAQLIWEYPSTAVGWTAVAVRDNTNGFRNANVNSVHWTEKASQLWDESMTVNGVTGYWVRCRVDLGGGTMSNPTQQNRRIYAITWPHYEVDAEAVGGDITAIIRSTADNQSDDGTPDLPFNQAWMGLRSYGRGNRFRAHLNATTVQLPAGTTYAVNAGSFIIPWDWSPSGQASITTVAGAQDLVCTWSMDNVTMASYWGSYHAFVRGYQATGVSGDVLMQLRTQARPVGGGAITPLWESEWVPFPTGQLMFELVDLGKVTLPPIGFVSPTFDVFDLVVNATLNGAATYGTWVFDLILMPVDEWAGSFSNVAANAEVAGDMYLDVDSVSDPKRLITAMNRLTVTGNIYTAYQAIANDHALVQANTTQRMYHLFAENDQAWPGIGCAVWLFTNQRYLVLRGNR